MPHDAIVMRIYLQPVGAKQFGYYQIFTWSMRDSNDVILCPSGDCLYSIESATFKPETGGYTFDGTLKVGGISNNVINSKFYPMHIMLDKAGSQEGIRQRTEFLNVTIGFGGEPNCDGCTLTLGIK